MITTHPQFARATVNLLWGRLMTVGFVEPYDAFDLSRLSGKDPQPTNPELLEALATDFRASGFRLQHTIKTIMKSNAYQLSARFPGEWNDRYLSYYPRHYARVMTGPEVIDALATVTKVPMRFNQSGETVGLVKHLTAPTDVGRGGEGQPVDALMQSFFQSNRRTPPQAGNRPSTLQALLLMRSTVVNDRVRIDAKGQVAELVASPRTDAELVDEIYLEHAVAAAERRGGAGRARGGPQEPIRRRREPVVGAHQQSRISGYPMKINDLVPSRRDVLKWGGVALAGTYVDGLVWPLDISANGISNPRGTARNCIFIELGGAISPMDCWDFKETRWTPKDLDVTEVAKDLYISRTLFPQLSTQMHRVALVRSLQAPELIHFNGQYHTQTGRSLNPAVAREIPAFGSVIAYELASQAPAERQFSDLHQHQPDESARRLDRRRLPADVGDRPRSRSEHRVRGVRRQRRRRESGARGTLEAAVGARESQRRPAQGARTARRRTTRPSTTKRIAC